MRRGDWKLHTVKNQKELFNLGDDPSEQTNLADQNPDMVKTLNSAFGKWMTQMADPITGGSRRSEPEPVQGELTEKQKARRKKRLERQK